MKWILVLCIAFLGLTGCSTVVREVQRSKSTKADSSASIDGQLVSMTLQISVVNAGEKKRGHLAGNAVVTAVDGKLPSSLDLYHFQVFTDGFSALTNYRRDKSGTWHSLDRYAQGQPTVSVDRSDTNLVMNFYLGHQLSSEGKYSIAVSLSDSKMQRHILTSSAEAKINQ